MHDLGIFELLFRQFRAQQQACHADDAVHRGPDLVAHIGQELALGLARGVCLIAGNPQFLVALHSLGFAGDQLSCTINDHRFQQTGALVEFLAVASDKQGDKAKRREQYADDQDIDEKNLALILDDDLIDFCRDTAGQIENLMKNSIEALVLLATNHTRRLPSLPTSHHKPVELDKP